MDEEQIFIQTLYNLILNPNTRDWERKVLIQTKNDIREIYPLKNSYQTRSNTTSISYPNESDA